MNDDAGTRPRQFWKQADLLFLAAIFVIGLGARLGFVFAVGNPPLSFDEGEYDLIARNLSMGRGVSVSDFDGTPIPFTFRPPGYPLFLSAFYTFFDVSDKPYNFRPYDMAHPEAVRTARIAQAVVGAFVPILTYLIALHLFNRTAARIAAIIMALYTTFIFFTVALMTENLFIPVVLVGFWLLLRVEGRHDWAWALLAGTAAGVAIMIRPDYTAFVPFLALWFYMKDRQWKRPARRFAAFMLPILLMVVPWSIRNYQILDQFVYLDTRTGYNLYIGYHEGADGSFDMKAAETLVRDFPMVRDGTWGLQQHNWGKAQAWKFIRENPGRALALVPLKMRHFWDLDKREYLYAYSWGAIGAVPRPLLAVLMGMVMLPFALIVTLGAITVVFTQARPHGLWLLYLFIICYTILYSVTFGEPRMHMPIVPAIAVLAGQGIGLLARMRRDYRAADPSQRKSLVTRFQVYVAVMTVFIASWTYGIFLSWDKIEAIFGPDGHHSRIEF